MDGSRDFTRSGFHTLSDLGQDHHIGVTAVGVIVVFTKAANSVIREQRGDNQWEQSHDQEDGVRAEVHCG
jgi:hypothetical protein